MDSNNGWIKLHRKLLDNPVVMKDSDHLAVWIYLLLNASHTEYPVLFGGSFLEEKHKAFLTGEITQQEFEQYLWDDVNIHCSDWLEKNIEKIGK